uniref:RING-type E3 ubiquitin transferase n=1 Tax=Kalanchoe fedtschenkoi TaxID=63787 RepID=A0A7N0VC33_KALFE
MACSAEISTSTHHTISHRHRPISDSIPPPNPRTRSSNAGQDPGRQTISALIGRKEKEGGIGKSKFVFGGLGCVSSTASPVSAPEVIRTAADWEVRRKKVRRRSKGKKAAAAAAREGISADVCCGPGIGFAADAALVDCVDSRRPIGSRTSHRQRSTVTRAPAPMPFEDVSVLDYGAAFTNVQVQPEVLDMSSGRQIHRLHRRTPGGLPEILMLESSSSPGRSFGLYDRFGGWRLDVDSMSYEELLALGDRIGYVGTGLREEEIHKCIRKTKHSVALESLPLLLPDNKDWSCSICQEGFAEKDEVGKLECNHLYHVHCIKQWLLQKNACPVCKAAAAAAAPPHMAEQPH